MAGGGGRPEAGGGVSCLSWPKRLQLEEEEICRGERDAHGGLLQTQWWLADGLGNTWWFYLLREELEEEMLMALVFLWRRKKEEAENKICSGEREEGWFFGLL